MSLVCSSARSIHGHYWIDRADEQTKLNYQSTLHYDDYRVGDGQGHITNRQGIRLGEPSVKVLDAFKEAVQAAQEKKERGRVAKQAKTLPVVKASKTGYSMLKPKQATGLSIHEIMHEKGLRTHDEVLRLLADTYRLYQQVAILLAPVAEQYETATPIETLAAVLAADPTPAVNAQLQERWGVTLEEVTALFEQAAAQGEDQKPVAYLQGLLEKQVNYKQGPVKRQENYQQKDFSQLTLEQLKALRIPEATNERVRRAVAAMMQYNREAKHPMDRWYIRAKEIKELVGGRGEIIAAYLKEHQAEIAQHHKEFELTERYNLKPFPVTEKIAVK